MQLHAYMFLTAKKEIKLVQCIRNEELTYAETKMIKFDVEFFY